MEKQLAENNGLLWAGYVLLFLFTFSMYFQPLLLLGAVVFIGGILARSRFRKQQRPFKAAHASWQVNTVWLTLLLGILAIIVLFAIAAWMGNDPTLEAKLDAVVNSNSTPQEMLRALWGIPGTKAMVATIIIFTLLCLIWPLKRVLHGMLALRSGLEPGNPGSAQWQSLALAVALQVLPMLLFVLL